jgi:hypothetical protein
MTEHISWLALERHALGETSEAERAEIEQHLSGCDRCRGRRAQVLADARPMPPLRAPARRWTRWVWLPALAAAALCLLLLRGGGTDGGLRAKGDSVVLTLVRERDGRVVEDARSFQRQDRFRVLLTCPPGEEVLDVVVLQGDQTHHPFDLGEPVACGSRVSMPGAFRISGPEAAHVCAVDLEGEPAGCVLLESED